MSRTSHPLERLTGLNVVKSETWAECPGRTNCAVGWRVTLANTDGDERTQSGRHLGAVPTRPDEWLAFWREVSGWMSRYTLELHMLKIVTRLTVASVNLIVAMRDRHEVYFLREQAADHKAMQSLNDTEFATVQYLCNLRLNGEL